MCFLILFALALVAKAGKSSLYVPVQRLLIQFILKSVYLKLIPVLPYLVLR